MLLRRHRRRPNLCMVRLWISWLPWLYFLGKKCRYCDCEWKIILRLNVISSSCHFRSYLSPCSWLKLIPFSATYSFAEQSVARPRSLSIALYKHFSVWFLLCLQRPLSAGRPITARQCYVRLFPRFWLLPWPSLVSAISQWAWREWRRPRSTIWKAWTRTGSGFSMPENGCKALDDDLLRVATSRAVSFGFCNVAM